MDAYNSPIKLVAMTILALFTDDCLSHAYFHYFLRVFAEITIKLFKNRR